MINASLPIPGTPVLWVSSDALVKRMRTWLFSHLCESHHVGDRQGEVDYMLWFSSSAPISAWVWESGCLELYSKFQSEFAQEFAERFNAHGLLVCPYCNMEHTQCVHVQNSSWRLVPTLDHVIPKEKDYRKYSLNLFNLIPACYVCNSNIKGTKTLADISPFSDIWSKSSDEWRFVPRLSDGASNLILPASPDIVKLDSKFHLHLAWSESGNLKISNYLGFSEKLKTAIFDSLSQTFFRNYPHGIDILMQKRELSISKSKITSPNSCFKDWTVPDFLETKDQVRIFKISIDDDRIWASFHIKQRLESRSFIIWSMLKESFIYWNPEFRKDLLHLSFRERYLYDYLHEKHVLYKKIYSVQHSKLGLDLLHFSKS